MPKVRVSGIVEESITDGPGLRYVVFTQGCPHHCPGCHNPETHDPDGGYLLNIEEIFGQFRLNPILSGITFSGGEPFLQAEALAELAEQVKASGKTVVCYTGFLYEELLELGRNDGSVARLLELSDLLIDGPYLEEFRDLELVFRGSSNQRLLDKAQRAALANRLQLAI